MAVNQGSAIRPGTRMSIGGQPSTNGVNRKTNEVPPEVITQEVDWRLGSQTKVNGGSIGERQPDIVKRRTSPGRRHSVEVIWLRSIAGSQSDRTQIGVNRSIGSPRVIAVYRLTCFPRQGGHADAAIRSRS